MEFTLFHHSFEVLGGSERVAVAVLNVLKSLGYSVTLVTLSKINKEKIKKWDPRFIDPDRIIIKKFPLKFGIYKALYLSLMTKKERSFSTIGDITWSDYSYIHFPWSLTDNLRLIDNYYKYESYIGNRKLRMYFLPYKYVHKIFFGKSKSRLLANSNWTRKILEISGYKAETLYPPVDISRIKIRSVNRDPKLVIYVGRISPEKNIENIIEVAKRLKDYKFIILGSEGRNKKYINYINDDIKNLNNVFLRKNPDDTEIMDYFSKAKIYFHPKINEHFGISIVEAMAAGLTPVVHKSGGAWYDIVEEGKYGLGYCNIDSAIESIRNASKVEFDYSKKIYQFSFENFKKNLSAILEKTS